MKLRVVGVVGTVAAIGAIGWGWMSSTWEPERDRAIAGALGWVAMMTMGSLYVLIPRLFNREGMWSTKLIDYHFWTSTIGVVLYAVSMWVSGITQGLMWRAVNDDGTLTYSFVESLKVTYPYYTLRLLGGLVFFAGMLIMVYNVYKTVKEGKVAPVAVMEPA